MTKIFDNSSESKLSSGGIHFPYFKHILPSLVKWMWSLDHQQGEKEPSKKNTPKLSLFVSPEMRRCGEYLRGGLAAKLCFSTAPKSCWAPEPPSPWWEESRSSGGVQCAAALPQQRLGSISPFFGNIHVDSWFYVVSGLLLMVITLNDSIIFHSYYPSSLEHPNILN